MDISLPITADLFDLLVCPVSRQPLKWVEGRLLSTDRETRRVYRVDGDIPVMLMEESSVLELPEWDRLMALSGPIGGGAAAVRARHA